MSLFTLALSCPRAGMVVHVQVLRGERRWCVTTPQAGHQAISPPITAPVSVDASMKHKPVQYRTCVTSIDFHMLATTHTERFARAYAAQSRGVSNATNGSAAGPYRRHSTDNFVNSRTPKTRDRRATPHRCFTTNAVCNLQSSWRKLG
jgi:hypothetical protein